MTNTKLLLKVITDRGLKKKWIAEKMGMSYGTFKSRIENNSAFSAPEIVRLSNILRLTRDARDHIFLSD